MPNHIVKTKEAHDFLALVPQLIGFTPHNSVVLVAFRGNRTCGAMRFNLPQANVPATVEKRIATSLIGMLCKVPGADAVVPVIYTAVSVSSTRGLPHERFADVLAKRAELSGFLVRDALCVGSDAWGSFLDPRCPAAGHPLRQIFSSSVYAAMPQELVHGLGSVHSGTELPTVDPALKERVGAQYRRLQKGFATSATRPTLVSRVGEVINPVELAEVALGWEPSALTAQDAATLLFLVQGPGARDQMMVQFAFGREAGDAAHAANLRYWELQRRTGLTMDDIVALELAAEDVRVAGTTGAESGAELVTADEAEARERRQGFLMGDLMLGNTLERPDPDRCDRAIKLLKTVVALAPRAARPAPLCMLAWLSWALGCGSVAGIFIDQALVIDRQYSMAQLLNTLLGSGHLPDWAFRMAADDEERPDVEKA